MGSSRLMPLKYNVSTFGGPDRDYQTLSAWEVATQADLVTAQLGQVLFCYADEASYNIRVNISGATVDADYFRVIMAAPGQEHDGDPSKGVRIIQTAEFFQSVLIANEDYSGFYNLNAYGSGDSANARSGIKLEGNYTKAIGNISRCLNVGAGLAYSFLSATDNRTQYYVNNIGFKSKENGFRFNSTGGVFYVYNNTSVYNGGSGIDINLGSVHAKNNIAQDNVGTQIREGVPLASDVTNVTSGVTFKDVANDIYLLAHADTVAKAQGTDLSGDAVFPFDDDILTNFRRTFFNTGEWTIGAHDPFGEVENYVRLKPVSLKPVSLAEVRLEKTILI